MSREEILGRLKSFFDENGTWAIVAVGYCFRT